MGRQDTPVDRGRKVEGLEMGPVSASVDPVVARSFENRVSVTATEIVGVVTGFRVAESVPVTGILIVSVGRGTET